MPISDVHFALNLPPGKPVAPNEQTPGTRRIAFSTPRKATFALVNISAALLSGISTIIVVHEFRRRLSAVITLSALSRI